MSVYPLVVESLGMWSSSSLETLKIITQKSTFMTGRTLSKAISTSNLHEQLSTSLAMYSTGQKKCK